MTARSPGWRLGRRDVVVGGALSAGALIFGAACETVDGQAVAVYLTELNELRDSTAGDDALLGERFNALIASGSRDAGAYLAIYRELRASNAAVLAKLELIQPPTGLERHHEDFVEGLSDLVTALDEVIRMIEAGNVIEANRLFQRAVTRSQAKQTGAMLQIRRVARSARVRV
ncbi:MAG: hypothetical protein OXI70_09465 [Chloroflexota bacterium]|nr:hypothetical protein [Chloroflexota bacterium]